MNKQNSLKTVVLLSGGGTTLQNIIDRKERGELALEFSLVISSRQEAYGLERAKNHDIPTVVIPRNGYSSLKDFNNAISNAINEANPDLILLAGFMSLLNLDDRYDGKIMNVHPALIPSFCGKGMYGHHVHEAVIESGVKVTGTTVHFVDNHYDTGPIIIQKVVNVLDDDTPDTLAERVQAAEREAYPDAIKFFSEGRLHIRGKRVDILPQF